MESLSSIEKFSLGFKGARKVACWAAGSAIDVSSLPHLPASRQHTPSSFLKLPVDYFFQKVYFSVYIETSREWRTGARPQPGG